MEQFYKFWNFAVGEVILMKITNILATLCKTAQQSINTFATLSGNIAVCKIELLALLLHTPTRRKNLSLKHRHCSKFPFDLPLS